jgi:hypothetical protein
MRFHAFWPLSQTQLFPNSQVPNSQGFGVGGEEVMGGGADGEYDENWSE